MNRSFLCRISLPVFAIVTLCTPLHAAKTKPQKAEPKETPAPIATPAATPPPTPAATPAPAQPVPSPTPASSDYISKATTETILRAFGREGIEAVRTTDQAHAYRLVASTGNDTGLATVTVLVPVEPHHIVSTSATRALAKLLLDPATYARDDEAAGIDTTATLGMEFNSPAGIARLRLNLDSDVLEVSGLNIGMEPVGSARLIFKPRREELRAAFRQAFEPSPIAEQLR